MNDEINKCSTESGITNCLIFLHIAILQHMLCIVKLKHILSLWLVDFFQFHVFILLSMSEMFLFSRMRNEMYRC